MTRGYSWRARLEGVVETSLSFSATHAIGSRPRRWDSIYRYGGGWANSRKLPHGDGPWPSFWVIGMGYLNRTTRPCFNETEDGTASVDSEDKDVITARDLSGRLAEVQPLLIKGRPIVRYGFAYNSDGRGEHAVVRVRGRGHGALRVSPPGRYPPPTLSRSSRRAAQSTATRGSGPLSPLQPPRAPSSRLVSAWSGKVSRIGGGVA